MNSQLETNINESLDEMWKNIIKQIKVIRNEIIEEMKKINGPIEYVAKNNGNKATAENIVAIDTFNGRKSNNHHIGINFYVNGNQCYYIGFNGLNCDISKGNIHSSEGRIQLFTGDGHPNKVLDKKNKIIKISYPSTSEDRLIQL